MKKKRIVTALVILLTLFVFAGCGPKTIAGVTITVADYELAAGNYLEVENGTRIVINAVIPDVDKFEGVTYQWLLKDEIMADFDDEWIIDEQTGEKQSGENDAELILELEPYTQMTYDIKVVVTFGTQVLEEEMELVVYSPLGEDTDRDGLIDESENAGWTIAIDANMDGIIDEDSEEEYYQQTSDPNLEDTDSDGLTDQQEYAKRTDPRKPDTDGDGVSDGIEVNSYLSSALTKDTDGDALKDDGTYDENYFDGDEIERYGTSPILADTDGDGMSDRDELIQGGVDPLIAELPVLLLTVNTSPTLGLNGTYSEDQTEASFSSALASDSATNKSATSRSLNLEAHAEAKFGASATYTYPASGSVTASAEASFGASTASTVQRSFDRTMVSSMSSQLDERLESSKKVSFSSGHITVGYTVSNIGLRSVNIDNVRIAVLKRNIYNPLGEDQFITELKPDSFSEELPVNTEKGPLAVSNMAVPPDVMMNLMRDPRGLYFKVSAFDLSDSTGNEYNYSAIAENAARQNSEITIDYGILSDKAPETHLVATSVLKDDRGRSEGLALTEILEDILEIPYTTTTGTDLDGGTLEILQELGGVGGPEEDDPYMFWAIVSNADSLEYGLEDFSDIVLKPTEKLSLLYVRDEDGDGLWDRQEAVFGTDPRDPNTDGDKILIDGVLEEFTDYMEVSSDYSWNVSVTGVPNYAAYGDPRFADRDGDLLPDWVERELGTDPSKWDTDGDGWIDYIPEDDDNKLDQNDIGFVSFERPTETEPETVIYRDNVLAATEASPIDLSIIGGINLRNKDRGCDDDNLELINMDLDSDYDGIPNILEVRGWSYSGSAPAIDLTGGYKTDPYNWDHDSDGLEDLEEVDGSRSNVESGVLITDPTNRDTDGDGEWDRFDKWPVDPLQFSPAPTINFDVKIVEVVREEPSVEDTSAGGHHIPVVGGELWFWGDQSDSTSLPSKYLRFEFKDAVYWEKNDTLPVGITKTVYNLDNKSNAAIQFSSKMYDAWVEYHLRFSYTWRYWFWPRIYAYIVTENKGGYTLQNATDDSFTCTTTGWPWNPDTEAGDTAGEEIYHGNFPVTWTDDEEEIRMRIYYDITPSRDQPIRVFDNEE